MNLWNANCDAKLPKSKRELLRDLEIWERTQGGMAPSLGPPSGPNAIMAKSFDAGAWSTSHGDDFRRLIEDARKKKDMQIRAKEPEVTAQESGNQPIDVEQPIGIGQPVGIEQPISANIPSSITQVEVSTAAFPEAPIDLGNPIELNNGLPNSEKTNQAETSTAEVQNGAGGMIFDPAFAPFR
jgi:hypothetical protein